MLGRDLPTTAASKLNLRHTGRLKKRDNLLTVGGGGDEGGGWAGRGWWGGGGVLSCVDHILQEFNLCF
jgi:hypothetical protein